ncbi:MAG: hypothetical protein PHH49_08475, partial [Candidatus Omnitrophica bacterium]|nr:hypothetical protein [Candidatus Omnitrophota bacterium]
ENNVTPQVKDAMAKKVPGIEDGLFWGSMTALEYRMVPTATGWVKYSADWTKVTEIATRDKAKGLVYVKCTADHPESGKRGHIFVVRDTHGMPPVKEIIPVVMTRTKERTIAIKYFDQLDDLKRPHAERLVVVLGGKEYLLSVTNNIKYDGDSREVISKEVEFNTDKVDPTGANRNSWWDIAPEQLKTLDEYDAPTPATEVDYFKSAVSSVDYAEEMIARLSGISDPAFRSALDSFRDMYDTLTPEQIIRINNENTLRYGLADNSGSQYMLAQAAANTPPYLPSKRPEPVELVNGAWKTETTSESDKGITSDPVLRNGTLVITADMAGRTPDRTKGEVYVPLPQPTSMVGRTIRVRINIPAEFATSNINGIQLFAKDSEYRTQYSKWTNVRKAGWVEFEYTPTTAGQDVQAWTDKGFDPSKVLRIGIKIALKDSSEQKFAGSFEVSSVSAVASEAPRLASARSYDVVRAAPITVQPSSQKDFAATSGASFYLMEYENAIGTPRGVSASQELISRQFRELGVPVARVMLAMGSKAGGGIKYAADGTPEGFVNEDLAVKDLVALVRAAKAAGTRVVLVMHNYDITETHLNAISDEKKAIALVELDRKLLEAAIRELGADSQSILAVEGMNEPDNAQSSTAATQFFVETFNDMARKASGRPVSVSVAHERNAEFFLGKLVKGDWVNLHKEFTVDTQDQARAMTEELSRNVGRFSLPEGVTLVVETALSAKGDRTAPARMAGAVRDSGAKGLWVWFDNRAGGEYTTATLAAAWKAITGEAAVPAPIPAAPVSPALRPAAATGQPSIIGGIDRYKFRSMRNGLILSAENLNTGDLILFGYDNIDSPTFRYSIRYKKIGNRMDPDKEVYVEHIITETYTNEWNTRKISVDEGKSRAVETHIGVKIDGNGIVTDRGQLYAVVGYSGEYHYKKYENETYVDPDVRGFVFSAHQAAPDKALFKYSSDSMDINDGNVAFKVKDLRSKLLESFAYDPVTGKISAITDEVKHITYHYDGTGRLARQDETGKDGVVTTKTFIYSGDTERVIGVTQVAGGKTTTYTYDGSGPVIIDLDGRKGLRGVEIGRLVKESTPDGKVKEFTYTDGSSLQVKEARETQNGRTAVYTYEVGGKTMFEHSTEVSGKKIVMMRTGRLMKETSADGSLKEYKYADDASVRVIEVKRTLNKVTTVYTYELTGKPALATKLEDGTVTMEMGRLVKEANPQLTKTFKYYGDTTRVERVEEITPAKDGKPEARRQFYYDAAGPVLIKTPTMDLGRISRIVEPDGFVSIECVFGKDAVLIISHDRKKDSWGLEHVDTRTLYVPVKADGTIDAEFSSEMVKGLPVVNAKSDRGFRVYEGAQTFGSITNLTPIGEFPLDSTAPRAGAEALINVAWDVVGRTSIIFTRDTATMVDDFVIQRLGTATVGDLEGFIPPAQDNTLSVTKVLEKKIWSEMYNLVIQYAEAKRAGRLEADTMARWGRFIVARLKAYQRLSYMEMALQRKAPGEYYNNYRYVEKGLLAMVERVDLDEVYREIRPSSVVVPIQMDTFRPEPEQGALSFDVTRQDPRTGLAIPIDMSTAEFVFLTRSRINEKTRVFVTCIDVNGNSSVLQADITGDAHLDSL